MVTASVITDNRKNGENKMRDMTKKIKCPKCGKMFQSLGYASHRAMHRREREKKDLLIKKLKEGLK